MTSSPSQPAAGSAKDPRVHAVELIISRLLRIGVIVSMSIVAAGTIVSFIHHPEYLSEQPALTRLTTPPVAGDAAPFAHSLASVVHDLGQGRGQAMVIVGLILLIATPVLRVAVSIFAFIYERDRRYVLITTLVLLLLLVSFLLGGAER